MSRNKSPLCGTLPFFATVAVMAITASGADSLLLHRWSFNNDFADSAGGQTATAIRAVKRGLCLIVNRNP